MGLLLWYAVPEKRKHGSGRSAGKERQDMEYEIRWVYGHVEVYDSAGVFRFSADSEREALEELAETAA